MKTPREPRDPPTHPQPVDPVDPGEPDDHDDDHGVEEQVLDAETTPEGVEYLGDRYASLDHYFRSELEQFVDPPIRWILELLDMRAVRARFEGRRYRYLWESGSVFRIEASGADDKEL